MAQQTTRHRVLSGEADDLEGDVAPATRVHKSSSNASARRSGSSVSPHVSGTRRWLGSPTMFAVLALLALVTLVRMWHFSLTGEHYPPLTEPFIKQRMVEFTTKFGTFTIELYPDHAPQSVETFTKLVTDGFYDATTGFYRNEPNFVLQGGGYLANKKSPLANLPVEYSLPSTERMVVIARGRKATSGTSEIAIMLHDNSDNPGYTVFGRVVAGWHTIQQTTRAMRPGYLSRDDTDRQVAFDAVQFVERVSHSNPQAKHRLEELRFIFETPFTVVLFAPARDDCAETQALKALFKKLKASVRIARIGDRHAHHPYERDALAALTQQDKLPLVYVHEKLLGGLADVQLLQQDGRLQALLERSGVLAEPTVWNAITQYPLVVFSKSYCPYCKKAKEALVALGAKPFVFELDLRQDGAAIQAFLLEFTHQATVPNVFIKGKSIGGADDTLALAKTGELLEKLQRAGAL